jgi:hypothetical protein
MMETQIGVSTKQVADKLVGYCRNGQFEKAQKELYADDCISIEPKGAQVEFAQGLKAILAKGEQWNQMVQEVHGGQVSDPIVCGNHFAITHEVDCTFKEYGRQKMEEVSVYEVRDGKVVKEQFFYTMG